MGGCLEQPGARRGDILPPGSCSRRTWDPQSWEELRVQETPEGRANAGATRRRGRR